MGPMIAAKEARKSAEPTDHLKSNVSSQPCRHFMSNISAGRMSYGLAPRHLDGDPSDDMVTWDVIVRAQA